MKLSNLMISCDAWRAHGQGLESGAGSLRGAMKYGGDRSIWLIGGLNLPTGLHDCRGAAGIPWPRSTQIPTRLQTIDVVELEVDAAVDPAAPASRPPGRSWRTNG